MASGWARLGPEQKSERRQQGLKAHFYVVARHAERADDVGSLLQGCPWGLTEDAKQWPHDPPLSDVGLRAAEALGLKLRSERRGQGAEVDVHVVVVSSPYFRCIQTAVLICRELGPEIKLIIDQSLGEIFGPSVMGEAEPASPLRPLQETVAFCDERGVKLESRRLLGSWPEWPESLRSGRSRMANRFLEYFRRGQMTNHNFILVSHADCIGSALSVIPTDAGCYAVEKVGYGGYFVARHLASQTATASDEEACALEHCLQALRTAALGAQSGHTPRPPQGLKPTNRVGAALRRQEALSAIRARNQYTGFAGVHDTAVFVPLEKSLAGAKTTGSKDSCQDGSCCLHADGWQIQTFGIVLHLRSDSGTKGAGLVLSRKVFAHAQLFGNKLKRLLTSVPEEPLEDGGRNIRQSSITSVCSTSLFGGLSEGRAGDAANFSRDAAAQLEDLLQEDCRSAPGDHLTSCDTSVHEPFAVSRQELPDRSRDLTEEPSPAPKTPRALRATAPPGELERAAGPVLLGRGRTTADSMSRAEPGEKRRRPSCFGGRPHSTGTPRVVTHLSYHSSKAFSESPVKCRSHNLEPDLSPLYQRRTTKNSTAQQNPFLPQLKLQPG
ncbi:unnamed protein product [Polarella glacialis]|uniref:Uncharacterized protein n=1 Tax=Polarella glacialis TaxID=89957 RepID=A0A813HWZ6_POLGL|nr:unnamed protein product [Polarella glacialis]